MKHSLTIAAALAGLLLAAVPLSAADAPPRPLDFAKDVRPILAKNCFACHGTDETHREGGLRLDLRDAAIKKLDDGKTAIVPGQPANSELVRRITANERQRTHAAGRRERLCSRKNKSTC